VTDGILIREVYTAYFSDFRNKIIESVSSSYPFLENGPSLLPFFCYAKIDFNSLTMTAFGLSNLIKASHTFKDIRKNVSFIRYSVNLYGTEDSRWYELFKVDRERKNEKPWAGDVVFSGVIMIRNEAAPVESEKINTLEDFFRMALPNQGWIVPGTMIEEHMTTILMDSKTKGNIFLYFQAIYIENFYDPKN